MKPIIYSIVIIVFFSHLNDQSFSQSLENSCPFQKFRCSDGSACLLSEKLCNGIEDCEGGEDENGNGQWDCSLTTLSTACSADEFRCRFGGCVPKSSVCDGIADCWGATDESTDLCKKRPTRRPHITRPTTKLTTFKPRQTTIRPTPQQPIIVIENEEEEEKYIPIELPQETIPQIKLPKLPSTTTTTVIVPKSPPKRPTEPIRESEVSSTSCPPLTLPNGADVNCVLNNFPHDCKIKKSKEGTMAIHKCKRYFDPPRTGSKTSTRYCKNGSWSPLSRNWGCSLQCGEDGSSYSGFIVGGQNSEVGKWPWHVGFYQENPPNSNKYEFFCGGTLISQRAVLTAAHCITRHQTSDIRKDPMLIFLGKHNRTYGNDDGEVQERRISHIEIREYYTPNYYEEDIALVWLDKDVEITNRVRPVCLPSEDDELDPGLVGNLAGWGRWADRGYPEPLQMAELPVVGVTECRRSHSSLNPLIRPTTFCAGYKNGTSACDGDSGGGLVFEYNRRYSIQGVVSAGINSNMGGCDPNHYTIFTKVSQYVKWIDLMLDRRDSKLNSK